MICLYGHFVCFFFFFFQAEDGIRDWSVTGVQTCALPISCEFSLATCRGPARAPARWRARPSAASRSGRPRRGSRHRRSEERRVGKECRARWSPHHERKKKTKKEYRSTVI